MNTSYSRTEVYSDLVLDEAMGDGLSPPSAIGSSSKRNSKRTANFVSRSSRLYRAKARNYDEV